ncbi:MAG: prepilin-type N-terminal cleavage/methylation domain-containing protein [Candidatus Wallbacteria bacterium]|nr:prepilin-type N-terminal cleavage/methylation domain-containing protein [Candidatus Wallbacteria bacterium]
MKHDAFTLIELSIAIVLIGIIAVIGYPNLSRMYYVFQLEGCVVNVAGDIRFIMNESLSHKEVVRQNGTGEAYINVCYGLEFTSDKSYKLYRYVYNPDTKTWDVENDLTEVKFFPAGAQIEGFSDPVSPPPHKILYNNRGEPTGDGINLLGNNQIIFRSTYINQTRKITIDLSTGKPRIE